MSNLLIVFIILLYTMQSLFCRFYSMHAPGDARCTPFVFSVCTGAAVTLLTFCVNGLTYAPSPATLGLGILNAAILLGYNLSLIGATGCGSYSIAMISVMFGGILIPLFCSVLFYHESLNAGQLIAIAIMLVAFVFLNSDGLPDRSKKEKEKISGKFVFYCVLVFLCNGAYGQLLSTQQIVMASTQRSEMIMTTYFFAALFALLTLLVLRGKATFECFRQSRKSLLWLILCCVVIFGALNLVMIMLNYINPAVFYTIDNGGVLMMSVLCSCIFFKERFTLQKIIGVALAVTSIVMLSVF